MEESEEVTSTISKLALFLKIPGEWRCPNINRCHSPVLN